MYFRIPSDMDGVVIEHTPLEVEIRDVPVSVNGQSKTEKASVINVPPHLQARAEQLGFKRVVVVENETEKKENPPPTDPTKTKAGDTPPKTKS